MDNVIATVTRAACSAFTPEEGDICTYPECKCQGVPDLCKVGILALFDAIREPPATMTDLTPGMRSVIAAYIDALRKEISG